VTAPDITLMPIPGGLHAAGSSDGSFEDACAIDDLPLGAMLRVTRGDLDLLVAHTPAGICVTEDRCPHMAAPLSIGTLEDCVVACPLHKGRFDLASGEVVQFPTTGGLDADGQYHPVWAPPGSEPKPEPADLKARARALTRIRRLRYYAARINGDRLEIRFPR
jgi:nitrite reductase/ring-hydroxylating ferredoxin subunit